MPVKIEKGIPMPGRKYYRDLIKMVKHDSFTFPESEFSSLRGAIQEIKRKHRARKFKTIRISEAERRIWRTK